MKAGKDVYCEKPMIHLYGDGPEMIEAARATKRVLQVGGSGSHAVKFLVAGAAEAWLITPMHGETSVALD